MASYKNYIKEISSKFGYHPTWEPNTKLNVGDIGVLQDGVFHYIDNISSLGYDEMESDTNHSETAVLEYSSSTCRERKIEGQADIAGAAATPIDANADFLISFDAEGSVYFKAQDIKTHKIKHQIILMAFILDQYKKDVWKDDWTIITELKEAASAIILYSNSKDANITLNAKANAGMAKIDLADSSAGVKVVNSKDLGIKIIADNPVTPLFKLMGIKKNWLTRKAKVVTRELNKRDIDYSEIFDEEIKPGADNKAIADNNDGQLYALFVGINKYAYVGGLDGCVNDAENFRRYIKESTTAQGKQLAEKCLYDEDAVKKNIIAALDQHLGQAAENDTCLFYFAGHGVLFYGL